MKRYLLFILLFVAFLSCKKDKNKLPSVVGIWEIRSEYASRRPTILYSPGNDTILKFTHNTFERFIDGVSKGSGKYWTMKDTYQGQQVNWINYEEVSNGFIRTYYRLEGNKLIFYFAPNTEYGGGSIYERIQ